MVALGLALSFAAHPSAAAAEPRGNGPVYTGFRARAGYPLGQRIVQDFHFELPSAVVEHVSVGSVLEPDDPAYQRVVVVGDGVGYCIDAHRAPPSQTTPYRDNGMRDERAAQIAREYRVAHRRADGAVWAWRFQLELTQP